MKKKHIYVIVIAAVLAGGLFCAEKRMDIPDVVASYNGVQISSGQLMERIKKNFNDIDESLKNEEDSDKRKQLEKRKYELAYRALIDMIVDDLMKKEEQEKKEKGPVNREMIKELFKKHQVKIYIQVPE